MLVLKKTCRKVLISPSSNSCKMGFTETKDGSRASDGRRQYCFEPGGKMLKFNSSKQNYDPQAKSHFIPWNRNGEGHNDAGNTTWHISSWALVVVGIVAYLLMNTANAEEEKNEEDLPIAEAGKPTLVTEANFREIIAQLKKDNPKITSLKVDFRLTEGQLQELYLAIRDNTELGYIS